MIAAGACGALFACVSLGALGAFGASGAFGAYFALGALFAGVTFITFRTLQGAVVYPIKGHAIEDIYVIRSRYAHSVSITAAEAARDTVSRLFPR